MQNAIDVSNDQIHIEEVVCPKCGSSERNILFKAKDRLTNFTGIFSVVRCKRCFLKYLNPRPTPSSLKYFYPTGYYEAMEEENTNEIPSLGNAIKAAMLHIVLDYPEAPILKSFPIIHFLCRPRLKWMWRILYSVRPKGIESIPMYIPNGKILCVGFGKISELESLRKLGWEVWGIDIDKDLVKRAQEIGFSASVAVNISDAGLQDNYFDAVLMSHVLEHVIDPFGSINEVRRVLKSGGLYHIIVPRNDSLYALVFGKNWIGWDIPRHLTNFDTKRLRASLVMEKFSIDSMSNFSTIWGPCYGFMYWISKRFHSHNNIPKSLIKALYIPSRFLYMLAILSRRGDILCVVGKKHNELPTNTL